jgi:nitrate/nitrite transport system substrate-binding protein
MTLFRTSAGTEPGAATDNAEDTVGSMAVGRTVGVAAAATADQTPPLAGASRDRDPTSARALDLVDPRVRAGAWAAGSDAPEKPEVKIGFMPLTDCAAVIMAAKLGLDKKYGIAITPSKESSWAGVRDKLVSGDLDAAHALYGLVYGVQLGIGGPKKEMAVLMTLNRNSQAITLSNQLAQKGVTDGASLAALMQREPRTYTFAQTFPTGTHAMWLYYWLAAHGIDPLREVRSITVPPPQMVAHMRDGKMDGFCAGEPWNAVAIAEHIGFTAVITQDIWQDHPEKVLGATADFAARYPNTARAMVAAILEASRFIDSSIDHRERTATTIAAPPYLATDENIIVDRMLGRYTDGMGKTWDDLNPMKFFEDGAVNFPYLSDGMWFMTQHKRWGLLKEHPDYLAIARQVNRIDIYRDAAAAAQVALPPSEMRGATLSDGVVWDPSRPEAYADGFKIHA